MQLYRAAALEQVGPSKDLAAWDQLGIQFMSVVTAPLPSVLAGHLPVYVVCLQFVLHLCSQDSLHGHPQQRLSSHQSDYWMDLFPALVPVLLSTSMGELEEEEVLVPSSFRTEKLCPSSWLWTEWLNCIFSQCYRSQL